MFDNTIITPLEVEVANRQKELHIGDVVYWVNKTAIRQWSVEYGILEEIFSDANIVKRISPRDFRVINGIKIKEFVTPTDWQKLPKGWNYDMKMFNIEIEQSDEYFETKEYLENIKINDPEGIKNAYSKGYLVDENTIDRSHFYDEIVKGKWRIVRSLDNGDYKPSRLSIQKHECYSNYDDAVVIINAEKEECERVAALSDYDYAIEEMEKVFERYIGIYGDCKTTYVEKSREFLLKQKNVEDIEVRINYEQLEWKYCKNKRWVSLPE